MYTLFPLLAVLAMVLKVRAYVKSERSPWAHLRVAERFWREPHFRKMDDASLYCARVCDIYDRVDPPHATRWCIFLYQVSDFLGTRSAVGDMKGTFADFTSWPWLARASAPFQYDLALNLAGESKKCRDTIYDNDPVAVREFAKILN